MEESSRARRWIGMPGQVGVFGADVARPCHQADDHVKQVWCLPAPLGPRDRRPRRCRRRGRWAHDHAGFAVSSTGCWRRVGSYGFSLRSVSG